MKKPPLYRKVNTTARGVHHRFGGDHRDTRQRFDEHEAPRSGMHGAQKRGLDYMPLFRFLLSKVGSAWDVVHAEAVARLDRHDPIFWMLALRPQDEQGYIRTGEASHFSGLRVDEEGLLRVVDPELGPHSLPPMCRCCTHTFNGHVFTRPFDLDARPGRSAVLRT